MDDLVRGTGSLEHLQGHLRVVLTDEVTEGVTHGELLLADPAFDKLVAAGLKHRSGELERLDLVQGRSTLEKSLEVDHDGLLGGTWVPMDQTGEFDLCGVWPIFFSGAH